MCQKVNLDSIHTQLKLLYFLFAADMKLRGAEKRSKYYQKYGNPNFGGEFLLQAYPYKKA